MTTNDTHGLLTDLALAHDIDATVADWIEEFGLFPARRAAMCQARYGTFAVLTYTDFSSHDHLIVAAKWLTVLFALDDHYCDEEVEGADPRTTAMRLYHLYSVIEQPALAPGSPRPAYDDPVWRALADVLDGLSDIATTEQMALVHREIVVLLIAMAAEASWHVSGHFPTVAEYLANRQNNGALTTLAIIDAVGGYEVPRAERESRAVRELTLMASNIIMYMNDLASAGKEARTPVRGFNLISVLAAERGYGYHQGRTEASHIHDQLMARYEAVEAQVYPHATKNLRRYLRGLRAWIAGNQTWSETTARYHRAEVQKSH